MSGLDAKSVKSRQSYAVALLVLQGLLTLVLSALMYIAPLSTAHCDDACDYQTVETAVYTFFVIALLAFIGSVFAVLMLRGRGWWVIAPPAVAIVVVTVAWFITTGVANKAMLL